MVVPAFQLKEPPAVIEAAMAWFNARASLQAAKQLADADSREDGRPARRAGRCMFRVVSFVF